MARIIVALDDMTVNEAVNLANKLSSTGVFFKVNDLLDDIMGLNIIDKLGQLGGVMDDPKIYDIPKTVANRVEKHARHNPRFITIHASSTIAMMKAAVGAKGNSRILGVTVLTSFSEEDCNILLGGPIKAKVLQYARNAVLAGLDGIVCSPNELEFLNKYSETHGLTKVTPGIRPADYDKKDDQVRINTAHNAVLMGADYLVIGRPITQSPNPVEAVIAIQEEINKALKFKGKNNKALF